MYTLLHLAFLEFPNSLKGWEEIPLMGMEDFAGEFILWWESVEE